MLLSAFIRLTQLMNGLDSSELQPGVAPAFEKGWQGGVANTTETAGSVTKSSAVIFVTSCSTLKGWSMAAWVSSLGCCLCNVLNLADAMYLTILLFSTSVTVLILCPLANAADKPASSPPLHSSSQCSTDSGIGVVGILCIRAMLVGDSIPADK